MLRRSAVSILVALLAAPGAPLRAGPVTGVVQGVVTLGQRPLEGTSVAFIELATGAVRRSVTQASGAFRAELPAGSYVVVAGEGTGDMALGRGPAVVNVAPGQMVTARLELQALPAAARPAGPSSTASRPVIEHQAIGCFVVGRCSHIPARIRATPPVTRARGYFRGTSGGDWFYVDMEAVSAADAGGDAFVAKLPGPRKTGSLTYYLSTAASDGSEERTPETVAQVVETADQCSAGSVQPGEWGGATQVFAAGSDARVRAPDFNDCDDPLAPLASRGISKKLLALLAGAAAVGIGLTIAISDEPATPSR